MTTLYTKIITCLALAIMLPGCATPDKDVVLTGQTMGTTYTVSMVGCESLQCAGMGEHIEARLEELTQHLSHYDPESELSAFNNHDGTDWFPASTDLGTVVDYALTVSKLSNGAFDITVAPAVDAWGFGPTDEIPAEPAKAKLDATLAHSGYTKLESRTAPWAIRKHDPLLRLDLSALAKGYAVDQLAYLLDDRGMQNYLVEIGGETRTAGVRGDGMPWRIGIQPPAAGLDLEFVVTPGDAAVATSGDYRNFYMLGDRRISHTIDPRDAQPTANGLMSVSVIAPDAMQADALATALMVMGPESGAAFATENGIAALMIERTKHGSRAIMSPGFERYRAVD